MKYVYWPGSAADILIITLYKPYPEVEALVANSWGDLLVQAKLIAAQSPVESPRIIIIHIIYNTYRLINLY